ncbi:hypothetical protein V8E36_002288, partial [Tilletia maclaganii]
STAAHAYRGPLSAQSVLSLLNSPELSVQARSALTGTIGGFLGYYHFIGMNSTPPSRRRPRKPPQGQGAVASSRTEVDVSEGSAQLREEWRCRACQINMHVPPGQISNLGAHLYGTERPPRPGCLELRASNPAEFIPEVLRDEKGGVIRIRSDKPVAAKRNAKSSR